MYAMLKRLKDIFIHYSRLVGSRLLQQQQVPWQQIEQQVPHHVCARSNSLGATAAK